VTGCNGGPRTVPHDIQRRFNTPRVSLESWTKGGEMAVLCVRGGKIDLERGVFDGPGRAARLTDREVDLLRFLAERPGEDVPRDVLLREVWGQREISCSRAVDATVARLRRKIEAAPAVPVTLCTAHREGYRLVLESSEEATVRPAPSPARRMLRLGARAVDLDVGLVRGGGSEVLLTLQERSLLERLARSAGRVVDPEALARAGQVIGGRGALANAILRLRGKLEDDPSEPAHLITVRGQGYRLDVSSERATAPAQTLWSVAEAAGRVLGLEDCVVYLRDGNALVQVAAYGLKAPKPGELVNPYVLPVGRGIVGDAARTGVTQLVPDVRADPRYVPDGLPGRSELAVPIVREGELVGVIDSESPRLAAYRDPERAMFESLARIVAAATADVRALTAA
jgi:DNA-binding response OmpR family regulator/putative methionine-R-sulfoxide reductase with GAF domain